MDLQIMFFSFIVCPTKCRCDQIQRLSGISIIGGMGPQLTQLPYALPVTVVELRLYGNRITTVKTDSLRHCENLTLLDLSDNDIYRIEMSAFDDLIRLDTLVLSNNFLHYNTMSFPPSIFQTLSSLKILKLENQKGHTRTSPVTTLEEFRMFTDTIPTSLKTLHIDVPAKPCDELSVVVFANFTELNELGIYRQNECDVDIRDSTFKPLRNLPITNLILKFDNLRSLEPLAFSWFPNLTSLDMSHTFGMSVADVYPAWIGLKYTRITHLDLTSFKRNMVNLDQESIRLTESFFENFLLPSLKVLVLDNTEISSAAVWDFSESTPNLTHLSVARNYMDVTELDLMTEDTENLKYLRYLDVSYQGLGECEKVAIHLSPNMEQLVIMGINECFPYVGMGGIELYSNSSLQQLNLNKNLFRVLPQIQIYYPTSKFNLTIDLSHNILTYISSDFLQQSIQCGLKLGSLILTHNSMGVTLDNDTGETFQQFHDLTYLDLSDNEITSLSGSVFRNLSNLEILDLSQNSLDSVSFRFSHMTNLRHIDLTDNKISRLNWDTINDLISISQGQHNLTVSLNGNVFECSCQTRTSLQWMLDHNTTFNDFERYTCLHNNTSITFDQLDKHLHQFTLHCPSITSKNNIALKAAIGLSVPMIIVFVILATIVRAHKRGAGCFRRDPSRDSDILLNMDMEF